MTDISTATRPPRDGFQLPPPTATALEILGHQIGSGSVQSCHDTGVQYRSRRPLGLV